MAFKDARRGARTIAARADDRSRTIRVQAGNFLLESRERRVVNGREMYLGTGPGISTVAYRDRGLGYVVTADYDEDTLTRLLTTSFAR